MKTVQETAGKGAKKAKFVFFSSTLADWFLMPQSYVLEVWYLELS